MAGQQTQTFEDELALIRCLPEINNFRNKRTLTDLSIEVCNQRDSFMLFFDLQLQGNVLLHVHKVIIAARIVSLRNSLSGMPRKSNALIKWPTISPEVAKPLIEYVYTGQLKVDETHAAGLVLLSKQLSLPHVEVWVVSFLAAGINAGNIVNNWNFARTLQNDQLLNACVEHIKETFETTITSDFFLQLPADSVLSILRADDLKVANEERVFEAICLWVSPRGEVDKTRVVHAAEMMKEVRWNRVNPDFRYKLLENEGFWNANVECLRLLGRISGWFEGPSLRTGRQCPFNDNPRSAFGDICLVGTSATSDQSVLIQYDVDTSTSEQLEILSNRSRAAFVAIEGEFQAVSCLTAL
ncbi:unnamed protein product [Dibothriocephalus latus]|uniref:BTB domain-containing protein n=1 Tax=Dibothriocephalus latus TaxID=60516 RepID=A0A3P7P6D2_DIBLA|nr:unnamed protein product [Dibothriocephalus latus]